MGQDVILEGEVPGTASKNLEEGGREGEEGGREGGREGRRGEGEGGNVISISVSSYTKYISAAIP